MNSATELTVENAECPMHSQAESSEDDVPRSESENMVALLEECERAVDQILSIEGTEEKMLGLRQFKQHLVATRQNLLQPEGDECCGRAKPETISSQDQVFEPLASF